MQSTPNENFQDEDLSPYQVHARREIVSLLRSLGESNQLIRMTINNGVDAVMTTILHVDETTGTMLIDCAPSAMMNQRIVESDDLSFETMLEKIRILFFAEQVASCMHNQLPAFSVPIPSSLIRLQRRENYRVATPVSNPVRCTIRLAHEDAPVQSIAVPLHNISGGGIAVVDEKKLLDDTIGYIYKNCRIDLPGGTAVTVDLQIRNSYEVKLVNGKTTRRVGCMFIDPQKAMLAAVQRYITKLEREQNARTTGLK